MGRVLWEREGIPTAGSRVGFNRNRICAGGGHGRMTVGLLDGISPPSTVGVDLAPEQWRRELSVEIDPTLRIDR